MALNLVNILSTTVAWLKTHNTSTTGIAKNLSTGLVKRFYQGVDGMHEQLPTPIDGYPCIVVELVSKGEDWDRVGNTSKRMVDINFNVICITQEKIGQKTEGYTREEASNEIIYLTQNVEGFLRTNIPLSGTVDWAVIDSTDYSTTPGDSYVNNVSRIGCVAKFYTN